MGYRASRGQEPPTLADNLADTRRTEGSELSSQIFGQSEREPLDLLGRAGELCPQILALGGDPGRTRVEMALPGHVAAHRDEHRGSERELLGAEQRGDQQVATRLKSPVGSERNPIAEVVPQQHLVDLR